MRTLVIGLDGACLPVLKPMIEDGVVPNIATLHDRSAVGPLKSQLPPWTPSAWPSMYTGVNPGKHGVYDFLHFDGYDWDVVNRSHVKEHAVWELLSLEGYRSVILNVPVTGPPPEFDGVLVPGYTAPEGPNCHPPRIWDELNRELGEYKLYTDSLSMGASDQERKDGYKQLTRMRGAAFRYLVKEYEPDFGFVQFQQCDTVYHDFPGEKETARRVYGAIDEEVGDIVTACEPDVTLLVSDHGIGPMTGREFRVNGYLRDESFLTATAGEGGMPSWKTLSRKQRHHDEEGDSTELTAVERALSVAARVGITSQRMAVVLQRLGLDDRVREIVPMDVIRAGSEQVDFAASTAYMRSRTEMGVRLNVSGREPSGVVTEAEYEQIREKVAEALKRVTTPSGDPIFERVLPRESVFDGPYLEDAPDLVTVPNQFEHYLSASVREELFAEPNEPWEHKLEGVVMAAGDDIDREADLSSAHLFDIAPTILATFGLPISDRMDSSPLPIVEPTDTTEYPSFDPDRVTATDDSDVEQRLADLGYLE